MPADDSIDHSHEDNTWWDDSEDPEFDPGDSFTDTICCPECGADVYEDADVCPACGFYITPDTSVWSGKPAWWILFGLLGIAAVILALSLGP